MSRSCPYKPCSLYIKHFNHNQCLEIGERLLKKGWCLAKTGLCLHEKLCVYSYNKFFKIKITPTIIDKF